MFNLLFHKLSGINGWSLLNIDNIDVARVQEMTVEERICILDKNYPYTLKIKYYQPKDSLALLPVNIIKAGIGYTLDLRTVSFHTITKRYKTMEDAKKEIIEIEKKKDKINKYMDKLRKEIDV